MSRDKRAEIVEAMVSAWHSEVADCANPECEVCNRAASAALDIALKAAAEIAWDAKTYAEACAYDKRQAGRDDNKECAEAQTAWRIHDAILTLTSEGTNP